MFTSYSYRVTYVSTFEMKNTKFLLVILILATVMVTYIVFSDPSFSFVQQSLSSTTNRTFYLFNSHVPNANETKLGIPTDLFTPSSISVNKGDNVTIHFYNVENEPHTFTIGMPYNIDKNVLSGQNTTIIFKA
ncbi:MAG: cupredoxin domain-containing protein, partial [Thermoproteota archaeon]|nr:cupredoxin domain-containing protein [Thermoproteota archaeon]